MFASLSRTKFLVNPITSYVERTISGFYYFSWRQLEWEVLSIIYYQEEEEFKKRKMLAEQGLGEITKRERLISFTKDRKWW